MKYVNLRLLSSVDWPFEICCHELKVKLANTIVFVSLSRGGCLVACLDEADSWVLFCLEFARGEGVELQRGFVRE